MCKKETSLAEFKLSCANKMKISGITLLTTKEDDLTSLCQQAGKYSSDCEEMGESVFFAYLLMNLGPALKDYSSHFTKGRAF
jgi:hypothetical protein